jgi:hypothetical protein
MRLVCFSATTIEVFEVDLLFFGAYLSLAHTLFGMSDDVALFAWRLGLFG